MQLIDFLHILVFKSTPDKEVVGVLRVNEDVCTN